MSTQASAGTTIAGRYVLVDRIGRGGAGAVWRARDQQLGREVAVKLLHGDIADDVVAAARFRREAAAAARLSHPHVVTVYDIGEDGGREHLVMELVDGPSLAELLEDGALPPPVVAEIGRAVGSALGAAHAQGLIHRDVKPANVLFTREGIAKVVDFGIARALDASTTRLTMPGSVMGTARYLSPEQLRDDPLDARADVYSLGLVLHEALTGRPPWGSGGAAEVAARRLTDELPAPSRWMRGIPDALDATIVRATRREVDDRHRDGTAFASTLAPLATDGARASLRAYVRGEAADPRPTPATTTITTGPQPPVGPPDARAVEVRPPPRPGAERPGAQRQPVAPRRRRRGRIRRAFGRLVLIALLVGVLAVGVIGIADVGDPARLLNDPDAWPQVWQAVRERVSDLSG